MDIFEVANKKSVSAGTVRYWILHGVSIKQKDGTKKIVKLQAKKHGAKAYIIDKKDLQVFADIVNMA